MRGLAPMSIALALLSAGCSDEPDFDARYDKAQEQIRQKAAELDAELEKRQEQAARSDAAAGKSNTAPVPAQSAPLD